LAAFLGTDDGANLLTAYKRAANIVRIEQAKDKQVYDENAYKTLPERPAAEVTLADALKQTAMDVNRLVVRDRFEHAMGALATLRGPVDEFFDKVTVNVDDPELRANRLRLLSRIRATMNQVADFSQIEG
jgi:glycyl-tRNA synthetase beta chain